LNELSFCAELLEYQYLEELKKLEKLKNFSNFKNLNKKTAKRM